MSASGAAPALTRNTAFSALGYALTFAVPVLTTPYILHRVSQDGFGVLTVLGTMGMWLARADFGFWAAIPREVADRNARRDVDGLHRVGMTWILYDIAVGGAIFGSTVILGRPVLRMLVPEANPDVVYPTLVAVAAQSVLSILLRHQIGTLQGLHRMDLTNGLTMIVTPLSVVGLVFFLENGWGIFGVVLNSALFATIQVVSLFVLLRHVGYRFGLGSGSPSLGEFRRLVNFGWRLEVNQVLLQVFRSDRLILSATRLPAALIGYYQIGSKLVDTLGSAVQTLSTAVFPAVSDLAARGDRERIELVLMRGTKYHALAAVGLLGFAALFGHELLVLWLGRPMPEALAVLRWMAAGAAAVAIVSCGQAVAAALGRPSLILAGTSVGLVAAGLLYMTLGRRYHYQGLAASISAGMVLAQAAFMMGFHGMLEFRWGEWVGNALVKPVGAALPLLAVFASWRLAAAHVPPVSSRLGALVVTVPALLLSAGLAWIFARALRIVDDYDMGVLKSVGRRQTA